MEIEIEAPRPAPASEVARMGAAVEAFRRRRDTELARMAMVSRGDVTRVEGYENLSRCIGQLQALQASYGQGSLGPALEASRAALAGLLTHRKAFQASFEGGGGEAVQYIYAGAVMALWATVSLLVAEGVEFTPDAAAAGMLRPRVSEAGAGRVAKSLLVSRLARFAAACERRDFGPSVLAVASRYEEAVVHESVWGALAGVASLAGAGAAAASSPAAQAAFPAAAAWAGAALGAVSGGAVVAAAAVAVVLGLLYFAKEIATYAYVSRTRAASWLELQAAFLETNAAALEPGRRVTRQAQLGYAQRLRQLADRVRVDAAEADREAAHIAREDDRAAHPAAGQPRLV